MPAIAKNTLKNIIYIEPNVNHQKMVLKLISSTELSAVTLKYDFSIKFLLKNMVPSLIIIGHGVPESNTLDLVNYLKNHPTYKNIKLLKLSPSKNKFQSIKYIQKGIDEVVSLTEISLFIFIKTIQRLVSEVEKLDKQIVSINHQITTQKVKKETIEGLAPKDLKDKTLILQSKTLMQRLKKAIQAKAIPFVVSEILTLTSFINSDFNELINVVKLDPALTVKVLRCANSAYYRGNMTRIYNLSDAVRIIGMKGLKNLVLGISILDSFQGNHTDLRRFKIWYHSIVTGVIAKEIAKKVNLKDIDDMFIMGMLHDIGTSFFDEYFTKEYKEVLNVVYEKEMPLSAVEQKLLGYDHAQIASYILESWGFNKSIIYPISRHNESVQNICNMSSNLKIETMILKLADIISNNMGRGISSFEEIVDIPGEFLMYLGINGNDIEELLENIVEYTNELIQVMFLHLDPALLEKCNDLVNAKNFNRDSILFYSYKGNAKDYSSYETILRQLNYEVDRPKTLYSLANLENYKFLIIDFSKFCNPVEYENFFKSLKKDYGSSLKICAIVSNELYNSVYNNADLPDNILYLKKPLSLKDMLTVVKKLG